MVTDRLKLATTSGYIALWVHRAEGITVFYRVELHGMFFLSFINLEYIEIARIQRI